MAKGKKIKQVKINEQVNLPVVKNNNNLLVWICVAAIALITFFVFSPSLNDGFTNWDDNVYTAYNPLIVNNSVPVVKIFETPIADNYHPITILSLSLNYQLGKLNPYGYHLWNVIFHILNTILVFFFIFLLTRRNLLMAAIVSLFFGIHPMHVESVTWVSERKDVLYVFFFMVGLITYLRYSETKKMKWYLLTLLLFIFSCLSKGMAVVFPVVLLLIDYLKDVKLDKTLILEKIPFFLLSIAFGIIAIKAQTGQNISAIRSFTVLQRLIFASYSTLLYIVKLFIPYKLSAFYPYPIRNTNDSIPLIYYFSPLILLILIWCIVIAFLKQKKEIVFGLLFYFICVVLVLQLIPIGGESMAERYSYLSYIGLLFVVAYLINKVWLSRKGMLTSLKYLFIIISVVSVLIFSYQAYSRTQVWRNSDTLWSDVITKYPNSSIAYYNRGNYYYVINEMDKALSNYTIALQLDSSYRDDYYNRGVLYANYYNRDDLAITDYTKAIALDSNRADAYTNRGLLYSKEGKNDLAITDYTKAIARDSNAANAYYGRAMLFVSAGKTDLALTDFNKVIVLDSTSIGARYNRGLIYFNIGKNDLALADFNKAIALNPYYAPSYYNRGLCYKVINNYEKAIDNFTSGIQLNPQSAFLYYNNRGLCYAAMGKYNESIADFSKGIELNPSFADCWLNRSLAEDKIGEKESAKADAAQGRQLQKK